MGTCDESHDYKQTQTIKFVLQREGRTPLLIAERRTQMSGYNFNSFALCLILILVFVVAPLLLSGCGSEGGTKKPLTREEQNKNYWKNVKEWGPPKGHLQSLIIFAIAVCTVTVTFRRSIVFVLYCCLGLMFNTVASTRPPTREREMEMVSTNSWWRS